jgi:hypothetical protein
MAIGLHKGFHDGEPVFEIREPILFEQLAELFFFLLVQCLWHGLTVSVQRFRI